MQLSLTEGKISRLLIRFSTPILLASLIQMGHSLINVFFLNLLASPSSVAGAWNGFMLTSSISLMFLGIMSGGIILLGQHVGAGQKKDAASAVGNIIILQILTAVLSITLIHLIGRWYIDILNVPTEADENGLVAASEAWRFMRIMSIGVVFQSGNSLINAMLRALGDSKRPMMFISTLCAISIALDYVFIGHFGLGAAGAALAITIAHACSFTVALSYILRKKLPFPFSIHDIRPDTAKIKRILRFGVPMSLQSLLSTISFAVIGSIINGMGVFASAANSVVNNIVNLIFIIPSAIGSALSAISAQNLGAGKAERAFRGARLGVLFSLMIAVPATLVASFAPTAIVSLIARDPDVIEASAAYLISFSWDFVLVSFVFCMNGFFNGCGFTSFVASHVTVASFAVRIPVSWALSRIAGATLFHVGIGTPAATVVSLIMCIIFYKVRLSGGKLAKLRIADSK